MKTCIRCKKEKDLDSFYKCGKYYQSVCKLCSIEDSRKWIKRNRDKVNGYAMRWRAKNIKHFIKELYKNIDKIN